MNLFDVILLVILLVFVWQGFRTGLIGAIGGFFGIIAGIVLGGRFISVLGASLAKLINIDNINLANILAFILIFIGVNLVVSLLVKLINTIFHIIPFIDLVNKLLGAVVGLIGGVFAVASMVYLISLFPISETINKSLVQSSAAPVVKNVSVVVKPFLPEAVKSLKSILE